MNIKTFLLPLSLALLTTWAIQYFWLNRGPENSQPTSGQTFVAPQSQAEVQPLLREVDFVDADLAKGAPAVQTRIETDYANYLFSNKGACLEELTFKRLMHGEQIALRTIAGPQEAVHESRCFLVALNQQTPFEYTFLGKKELETAVALPYRAETDAAVIQKTFTIYKTSCKIDVELRITPKKDPVQARLIFVAPLLIDMNKANNKPVVDDTIAAIYNTQKGSIAKEPFAKLDLNKGWLMPTLFGAEDRYFVHALVSDQNGFAKRAYYGAGSIYKLTAFLESASIIQEEQWTLSFYFGPKEDEAMNPVDPRLEQTLDYSGWLAPLSRLLLMILKYLYSFVHNYGWAIILMTFLINLILMPFNIRSAQGMKKYTEFQKKLAHLQQRYKNDPDTLARERTELIAKHGMPGLGSCLPKLLQLPIFFALSRVLSSSIELYRAPFALWIHDLSIPDPLYILPLLITLSMIVQPVSNDPKQRFTMIAIALVFGAFATKFSAGLCLYILVGVILNGLQTMLQQKMNWA